MSALHQGQGTVADQGKLFVLSQPALPHLHAESVHVCLAQKTHPATAPSKDLLFCFLGLLRRLGRRCLALALAQMIKMKVDLRG